MGVYGTQTTLTTPTLDDRVVLSDAGVTKSSTLQQVLDVLVPAIPPADLDIAAADVSYDDTGNTHVTGADVQAALDAAEVAIVSAVSGGYTDEQARDAVGTALTAGEAIDITVDDPLDTITISAEDASDINKGVVELATGAETKTGTDTTRAIVASGLRAFLDDFTLVEWEVTVVGTSGSTETIDTSTGSVWHVTMDQNCEFTFSNPAPAGNETEFKLYLDGAFTPTWPASVVWHDGTEPTYATPAIYVFSTIDNGTTWFGSLVGSAFA